jgi:hypothetical protein
MSEIEMLAGALVLLGLYTTWLQFRYSALLRWSKSAQLSLILAHAVMSGECDDEESDSPSSDA